ncbi:MAG: hypothetical protein PQ612_01315 [Rickettsiales bacterium]|nr:hypothetical protein [Pseudomonadota bacterium]MDA0965444.1 hypothetical protein [Pseudomonadota bacterium]MDG4542769.1 hypothetical protein [Rickettsiales bacterium]MDG4544783.1 hypothetical protein [Rickettsiales bacterium]MDG4546905.1 hypothetical protein [Rickettsiales bacterium]
MSFDKAISDLTCGILTDMSSFVDSFSTFFDYNNENSNTPNTAYKTNKTEYYKDSVPIAKYSESPEQVRGIYSAAGQLGLLGSTHTSERIEYGKKSRFEKLLKASAKNEKIPKTRRASEHIRSEMIEKKTPFEPKLDTITEELTLFDKDSKISKKEDSSIKQDEQKNSSRKVGNNKNSSFFMKLEKLNKIRKKANKELDKIISNDELPYDEAMFEVEQKYQPQAAEIFPDIFKKEDKTSDKDININKKRDGSIKKVTATQRDRIFDDIEHDELKEHLVNDAKEQIKQDEQKKQTEFSREVRNKIFDDFNKEDEIESTLSKNQKAVDKGTDKNGHSWVSYVDKKTNKKGTLFEI